MTISSHELISSEPNGIRFDVRYKFVDHLGVEIFVTKKVAAGFDTDADMFAMIPGIELEQAKTEVGQAVTFAASGISPDIVPNYQEGATVEDRQANFDRRALGQFMTLRDVNHFNEGRVLFLAMEARGGANAGQRATYLGITSVTYGEIDNRFSDLAGAQTFIEDNKNQRWDSVPEEMI